MVRHKIPLKLRTDCFTILCSYHLLLSWSPLLVYLRFYSPWSTVFLSTPSLVCKRSLREFNIRSTSWLFTDLLSASWFQTLYFLMITYLFSPLVLPFLSKHSPTATRLPITSQFPTLSLNCQGSVVHHSIYNHSLTNILNFFPIFPSVTVAWQNPGIRLNPIIY